MASIIILSCGFWTMLYTIDRHVDLLTARISQFPFIQLLPSLIFIVAGIALLAISIHKPYKNRTKIEE